MTVDKTSLRQQMLTRRQGMSASERMQAAQSVKLHFLDFPHLTYAKSFAGYYPMRGEVDVLPIFNHMTRYNKQMALPRVQGEQMQFYRWQPGQQLQESPLGVKEPEETNAPFSPEVVLVPLLAFDSAGYRLGYGGGYYDRCMKALREQADAPLFIGVAYSEQEVLTIPREPHDERLDGILTQKGASLFA